MNKIPNTILMLLLIGSLVLNGCGGGSVFAEGGIGGTGISTGTVTGIGSITVNGVTYNTDNAAIYIEGRRVDDQCIVAVDAEDCLRNILGFSEGQVVRVVENFDADGRTGTADEVYYNDSLEGPVEVGSITQIDASTLLLIVMGQTVIVNSQTYLFDTTPMPITINDISAGDLIEVSGFVDDQNRVQAGYLLNKGTYNSGDTVEIKGVIQTGSLGLDDFRINGLLIDYSSVSPSPSLQEGMQVEVKGTYNGSRIDATSTEKDDDIDGLDDDEVEYEGIVTTATVPFIAGNDFLIGVQMVRTNSNTVFKGGLDEDIVAGVRLEVEGYMSSGILIAEKISFYDAIEIDAQVDTTTVSPTSDTVTFNLDGLNGITVQVNWLSNISGANDFDQLVTNLLSGGADYVEVRGRDISSGGPITIFAEEIKIEEKTDNKVKIQGPVTDNEPIVTILEIDIDVTNPNNNITEFEDINEQLISQAVFFSLMTNGNIVGAEGKLDSSGGVSWEKLEIEDEE